MYGVDPAGNECDELKQVMSLYTKIAYIKKGEHISLARMARELDIIPYEIMCLV